MAGERVLMVDDSPEDIALVTATMVRHDANIVIDGATSIASCLEALDKNEYDLLLIDYELSAGEDGLELIAKVKERDLDIPIIFMTGWGSEKVAAEAFRQGVVDYFVKEVDYSYVSRLANSIRKAVAQARAEKEREQLREQLEVSEMRYRALAESTYEAILGLLADGTIIFGNEALQRLFYLDPKAVISTNIYDYISIGAEDGGQPATLAEMSGREVEGTWKRSDGSLVPEDVDTLPTMAEKMERYQAMGRRMLVLDYDQETYGHVTGMLATMRERYGVESNAECVERMAAELSGGVLRG